MFIVMGATGNVGRAVADHLLENGQDVVVVSRDPERAAPWRRRGARIAKADVEDVASLREAFRQGDRAFLLNPPAAPSGDTDADERRTIANILAALDGASLEKVVAASTYGARPGDAIGDLSTLWQLEEGLRMQPVPAAINRGAYYMTNWLSYADQVRDTGVLPSMFPADTELPMVAPSDVGRAAAERLMASVGDTGIAYVEGPARYTPNDVAEAFSRAFARKVTVEVAPRETWPAVFRAAGFSKEAAQAYARMTAVSLDDNFVAPTSPIRGSIGLLDFIAASNRA